MKIEQHCINLEQAKKLKELGIGQQDSLFYFIDNSALGLEGIKQYKELGSVKNGNGVQDGGIVKYYSAFTVAELGVMLPDYFKENDQQFPFKEYYSHTNKNMWKFNNFFTGYNSSKIVVDASTEAEARAVMLIYLLDNKHIAAEECNARLTA